MDREVKIRKGVFFFDVNFASSAFHNSIKKPIGEKGEKDKRDGGEGGRKGK